MPLSHLQKVLFTIQNYTTSNVTLTGEKKRAKQPKIFPKHPLYQLEIDKLVCLQSSTYGETIKFPTTMIFLKISSKQNTHAKCTPLLWNCPITTSFHISYIGCDTVHWYPTCYLILNTLQRRHMSTSYQFLCLMKLRL